MFIYRSNSMKSFEYENYGHPDVLRLKEIPVPVPQNNEVLVRIRYVSLNASDYELLTGKPLFTRIYGLRKPRIRILGSDIAGTVEKTGSNVEKFKAGDNVFGDIFEYFGGFAEYVSVPEKVLTKMPEGFSFKDAAALPQAGAIALQGIRDRGQAREGKNVLINGAGGGAGSYAVQIAKYLKAEVTGVDRAEKLDFILSLGADKAIDYRKEDFTRSGEKFDLILDLAAFHSVKDYSRVLKPEGIYLMVGGSMSMIFQLLFLSPFISLSGRKKMGLLALKTNKDIDFLIEIVMERKILTLIDKEYSFKEIPDALEYLGAGKAMGKVVVNISENS